jgi:putative ABC transport system permease protein
VRVLAVLFAAQVESARVMTTLLAAIASVSLLVGGIGIMNIMLVSVTERTREIGLRMAVGARGRDILAQFLVEAVTLSAVGGLMGVAIGVLASVVLARWAEWSTDVSIQAVGLAFVFAGVVGVFFGFYPAQKAARLDPIEALRYE